MNLGKKVFLLLGLAAVNHAIGAQDSDDAITSAEYANYKALYPSSSLCDANEITLWRCDTSKKKYALCSSRQLSKTSGYLQYRAASSARLEFVFPAEKQAALGHFSYESFANGDAILSFRNAAYEYQLVDPLRDRSSLRVNALNPANKSVTIVCQANQTLQLNYTLRLMAESGLWPRDD